MKRKESNPILPRHKVIIKTRYRYDVDVETIRILNNYN